MVTAKETARAILLVSVILIAIATLSPFDFVYPHGNAAVLAIGIERVSDIIENIILFVPLGIGLTGSFGSRNGSRRQDRVLMAASLACGFVLSGAAELTQVFLPGRYSSLSDLVCNSLGAFLGSAAVVLWRRRDLRPALWAWLACVIVVSIPLQMSTSLRSWDLGQRLAIGNEPDGGRPWKGRVITVEFSDRALAQYDAERWYREGDAGLTREVPLIGSYSRLEGFQPYLDERGNLPPLFWRGAAGNARDAALFDGTAWLCGERPASFLTRRLAESSQFTILVRFEAHAANQPGPARILTLSSGMSRRNFTLAQEGRDLVFRLRTRLTGPNGASPELVVPGAVVDFRLHTLVATYDGSVLTVSLDGAAQPHVLKLNPGAAAARYFVRLTPARMGLFGVLFDCAVFCPLGALLSLTLGASHAARRRRAAAAALVILCVPVLVEALLAGVSGRFWDWSNVALGALLCFAVAVLVEAGRRLCRDAPAAAEIRGSSPRDQRMRSFDERSTN